MIINPDPSKYKLKKIKKKGYVLVNKVDYQQILNWRKHRKQAMATPDKWGSRRARKLKDKKEAELKASAPDRLWEEFKCKDE